MAPPKKKKKKAAANGTSKKANTENNPSEPTPEQAEADISATKDASSNFTCFGKLPQELRLKIWGFAAPKPYIVVERRSQKSLHGFSYTRPVPAVLHACKESRTEFLEPENTPTDDSLVRRRLDHVVFKLHFRHRSSSNQSRHGLRSSPGIFFSAADSFWGTRHPEDPRTRLGLEHWAVKYSGIASLDIAKTLRHLVMMFDYRNELDPSYFPRSFPELETLTLLLIHYTAYSWGVPNSPVLYSCVEISGASREADLNVAGHPSPEVDGQLNTGDMPAESLARFEQFRSRVTNEFANGKKTHPDWKAPLLKFRLVKQFLANEGTGLAAILDR